MLLLIQAVLLALLMVVSGAFTARWMERSLIVARARARNPWLRGRLPI